MVKLYWSPRGDNAAFVEYADNKITNEIKRVVTCSDIDVPALSVAQSNMNKWMNVSNQIWLDRSNETMTKSQRVVRLN